MVKKYEGKKMRMHTRKRKQKLNKRKIRKSRRKMRTRKYQQRGGFFVTDIVRGAESGMQNTINTLKGVPLSPSPFPTRDQPIDRNVEVI